MSVRRDDKERRAAMATVKKAYRAKTGGNHAGLRIIGAAVSVLLLAACTFSVLNDMIELSEKRAKLEELRLHARELEAENAGYESILNEEDERTYMERIAIEKLGYAYPDERRFYDTTRN